MKPNKIRQIISALCITLFVAAVFPPHITGQTNTTTTDTYMKHYTITFEQHDLNIEKRNGYDTIRLADDVTYTTTPGQPELPVQQLFLPLPPETTIKTVTIDALDSTDLPGEYLVTPAQPSQYFTHDAEHTAPIDQETYRLDSPWPAQIVRLVDHIILDDQPIAVVEVFPLRYTPSTKTLSMSTSITFTINGITEEEQQQTPPQTLSLPAGDYKYVIITKTDWIDDFQPLAHWRTQRGITTTIVDRDWIYSTYTGTNQEKIRSFIIDAKNTWGTQAILLGGDVTVLPYYIQTVYIPSQGNKLICCDTYYANTDSNFYTSEMWIGRAPVTTTAEITIFIDKIFTYEKNPPTSNYIKKAGLFGFDLDAQTQAEDCKILIDNTYIPSNWTMTNVYDSHGGNHLTNVIAAVNAGQHLLNHMDHSDYYLMGAGIENHGLYLNFVDVDSFSNGDKQSIIYSCGCWAAAYDYNPCIAEKWVLNPNGGAIAFIGNTRYGWYTVGNPYTCSGRYDYLFYQSFFNEHRSTLGDCFTDHKNSHYPSDGYDQYVFTELTLLGDPELQMWTENPETLVVTHPTTVPLGSSSFTVHVEKTSGADIQEALVVLWKGTEVYLTGTTNSNGDVTFTPSPTTTGTLLVTATKKNYLPYEGSAEILGQLIDPDQSFVTMTDENLPFLITCPAADGPLYQHVMVTCRNAGGSPVQGIPATEFAFILDAVDAIWYDALSCTFTAVDSETNANGELKFTVRGETSIYGNITVQATVQSILINDVDILPCKSVDYDVNGVVALSDFTIFGGDYTKQQWRSDFTGDGIVALGDFTVFGGHYTHHD